MNTKQTKPYYCSHNSCVPGLNLSQDKVNILVGAKKNVLAQNHYVVSCDKNHLQYIIQKQYAATEAFLHGYETL